MDDKRQTDRQCPDHEHAFKKRIGRRSTSDRDGHVDRDAVTTTTDRPMSESDGRPLTASRRRLTTSNDRSSVIDDRQPMTTHDM